MPSDREPSGSDRPSSAIVLRHTISAAAIVAIVVGALVIVIAASAVARDGDVPSWERSILEFFNGWPDWLEPVMWVLQQAGILFAPVIVGLVIYWVTRQWRLALPFVLVLPLKLFIEKALVKQLVERERPFVSVGESINVRGPAFEGLSFPSGHTTTAFATAVLLSAFLPRRWQPLPIVWAAIVGVARLYYGEHNALDIVAGAALGTAFASVLWFVFLNPLHERAAASDGHVPAHGSRSD